MLPFILLDSPVPIDVPDLWKTIVITLFILSMINERITNFIKLNIESILSRLLGSPQNYEKLFNDRTNFSMPEKDKDCEKKRERGILNFTVICGFFIASFCGADLLFLVQTGALLRISDPNKFWDIREMLGSFFRHGIGFLLTAFFISLGSKFWHDLLDVLLYTSNLKRKLVEQDPILFSSETADEVKEAAELTDRQLVSMAQKQFIANLPGQILPSNVVYMGQGRKVINGRLQTVIIFYLSDTNRSTVPEKIRAKLGSGREVDIATYTMVNVDAIPEAHGNSSLSVKGDRGSICCLLSRTDQPDSLYALTCSHVMTNKRMNNMGGELPPSEIISVSVSNNIEGKWVYGFHNSEYDIALIEINKSSIVNEYDFVKGLTASPANDRLAKRAVKLHSQESAEVLGFIVGVNESVPIKYSDAKPVMNNLLEIGDKPDDQTCRSISRGGDSGALLYDANTNEPVAMVIAGSRRFTYAIPLHNILQDELFQYQIFTKHIRLIP